MNGFVKFTAQSAINGFVVIDEQGHVVAERGSLRSATGTAFRYNQAAANGSLAYTLGGRQWEQTK